MSHLGSSDPCKGEKTQNYVNSQAARAYNSNNIERYTRTHHDGSHRQSHSTKELEDIAHRRDLEQLHALSSGSRHPEYPSREPMNPVAATSHPPTAVAPPAAIYPRTSLASQPGRSSGPPAHFEGFGLSSHIPANPQTSSGHLHSAPVHSSSYRHLIPHNLLPGQFSNSSGSSHIGLDVMWQQKMNPNPWIVAHYEEMRIERERTMAHEKERLMAHEKERMMAHEKERMMAHEKERMMAHEKERMMAHEKERMMAHEKERMMAHEKERMMAHEKERMMAHEKERLMAQERERAIVHDRERDHERVDRQKEERIEKERQREWQDQERLEREERERAQREAVQQHFEESLRLALQKKSMGWNPVSSNKNVGKGQESNLAMNLQSTSAVRSAENERLRDQEKERSQYPDSNHARREHERWLAMVQQQRNEPPPANVSLLQNYAAVEPRSVRSASKSETPQMPGHGSSKPSLAPSPVSSSASQMKNETNFSLYGYQPFQHTYITHAQLKAREETKVPGSTQSVRASGSGQVKTNLPIKVDKDGFPERPLTPGSSHVGSQGSSKQHLKVIHSGQDRSGMMYQPLVGSGGAFKPYEYSSNSSSPAPPAHQNTSPAVVGRMAHYQQLQDQPQNLVKGDGKGTQEKINTNHKYNSRDSKLIVCTSNALPAHFSPPYATSKSTPPAANSTYSYSLIQQGLVPNPMYIAATHAGSSANSSTPPVSFALSQSSKVPNCSASPPVPQNSLASPNSGITSGSPVCRPNSVPYTLPPGRISRSYSPVGSLGPLSGNTNSGKIVAQDPHVSNRAHMSAQTSSHRSPSPAHLYGAQPNPGASNSPHQSSPRLTAVSNHPSSLLSIVNATSPFHSSSLSENTETSGIPLVKRKLLNDVVSRKRPKSIDDGLLPPQLQPQIQTSCIDSGESQIVAPPHLVSNAPILAENQSIDSFVNKSNPSSPAMSSNLAFKPEPVATPPSMPDLLNSSPMTHVELHTNMEQSVESQGYFSGLGKFKISSKSSVNPASAEDSMDYTSNSQIQSVPERTVTPLGTIPDSNEEQLSNSSLNVANNTTTNNSNSSSSSHPKLKKAWLQRHSENEDKKYPNESSSDNIKIEQAQINTENQATFSDNCKSEPFVLIENSLCDKYLEETKLGTNDSESVSSEHKSLDTLQEDSSSSESDEENVPKSEKRKHKSKSKSNSGTFNKRSKTGNSSDTLDDPIQSPKKEKDSKKKSLEKDSNLSSRKRGRKTKGRSVVLDEASKKKGMQKNIGVVKPPEKPSIAQLRKTGEPFLQDGPCCEVAPRLPKCRECRMTPHQRSKKMPNIFCRFYAYRKLRYGKNGTILSAGFSEPADALEEDLRLWLPPIDVPSIDIEIETSKFLLTHIGDQFCDLVEMEREAQKLHMSGDGTVTWKRVVQGVREMCDVCETTLFNIHWVCHKCGFVVCIDCYKSRKNDTSKDESTSKDRDDYQWLLCTNRQPHEQEKLMMTQIIAGTALWDVGKSLHEIRRKWNIPTYCSCGIYDGDLDSKNSTNGICKLMSAVTKCFSSDKDSREANGSSDFQRSSKRTKSSVNGLIKQEDGVGGYSSESGGSPLSWLADVALNTSNKTSDDQKERDDEEKLSEDQESNADASVESDDDKNENFSTLRELLIRPTGKMGGKNSGSGSSSQKTLTSTLDEVISCVIEQKVRKSDKKYNEKQLLHFTRRFKLPKSERDLPPVRTCMLAESTLLYPEVPHLWFGCGKILLLKDPYHSGNMQMFQEQWKRGQPVIVADVGKKLDPSLWTPDSFLKEFGDLKTDFLNCLGGSVLQNQPMKKFWEGFENISKRIKNEDDESLILKLIDWPPADEFSDILPSRYNDLMKVLPLPQYTHRDGVLNMASHLPECFVQPDLGPRMYNAYGMSSSLGKGSTNLHLDVSDAINILAYVAFPRDGKEEVTSEMLKSLEECGCDTLMRKRAKEKGSKPGAVWHVYNARDADKIRDFLNKVSEEQGIKLNPHHDPIHNHEWYLDEKLRQRLHKEYGVEPYTIAQCCGDAIFIPAGSPHQVMNLFSCVKVSEDFVSPESVGHSFFLTQEIRNLSDNLTNTEDRLQIKNIIYHAVKNALAQLQSHDPKESKT